MLLPEMHTYALDPKSRDYTMTGVRTARLVTDTIGHLDIDLNQLTG